MPLQGIVYAGPLHACRSAEEYERRQQVAIAKLRRFGWPVQVHEHDEPVQARLNHGVWRVDCPCGNAPILSDPDWGEVHARCYACGAVLRRVELPDDREQIEELMLDRPATVNRNWRPHEKLEEIRAENDRRGVRRRGRREETD